MSLEHVAGTQLVADGMTKQLTGQALQNFKKTLGIGAIEVKVKKVDLNSGIPDPRFAKGLGLLVAVASMVHRVEASETTQPEGGFWSFSPRPSRSLGTSFSGSARLE